MSREMEGLKKDVGEIKTSIAVLNVSHENTRDMLEKIEKQVNSGTFMNAWHVVTVTAAYVLIAVLHHDKLSELFMRIMAV